MTRKYAGSYLYTNLGIREPKTLDELHDLYGITSYSTDVESYSYLYSTSSDTWLDPVSVQGATILYDSVNNLYFISNIFEDSEGTNRWFSINQLAIETYSSVGVSATGLSFSDTEVSVYNIETGDELKAIEYVDDKDSDTKKYLIKGEIDHFEWLTALQLEDIGYSLTSPIPEEVPSFVLLDNTTGEILHSSTGIMGYIPHTVIHKVQEDSVIYIDHSLPNVTQNNDFGQYNWLSTSTGSYEYILPGATSSELEYLENDSYYRPDYDSNNVYGIIQWQEVNGTLAGRTEFAIISAAEFGSSNKMLALNVSNDGLNFLHARVAVCDRHTAYIVPVYDLNNDAYNSFKFLMDGTYYYFVLDGVQNTWTDDLSTIGYTETLSLLPRVTFTGDAGIDNIIFGSDPQTGILGGNLAPNSSFEGLYYDNGYIPSIYDSSCVYAAIGWYTHIFNEFGGRTEVALLQGSFHQNTNAYIINIKNISSDTISLSKVKFATCHNASATIVTVYDSNNDSYNAFKYTLDGTDYYYVLDEVQSDWTDDLGNIGYSLTPVVVLPTVSNSNSFSGTTSNWLYSSGSGSGPVTLQPDAIYTPYIEGSSSAVAAYDSTKSYAVIKLNTTDSGGSGTPTVVSIVGSSSNVAWKNITEGSITVFATKVAVCSSSNAIVVTVYDSNNNLYNAFKYSEGTTNYYYVLDDVQTDWTDDLSSIGYTEKEYIETAIYSPSPYRNGGVTSSSMPGSVENAYDRDGSLDPLGWYSDYYYYWDFSKRYEFGWYDNGVWVPYPQTLADMPVAADTDHSFIILPYGERYIYFGWNDSNGAYLVNKKFRCRIYHDAFSVWQNSGHTDQYPNSAGLITDITYDSTKVYKALYMLTEAGALVNITDLYKVTFSEDNGYLKITVPNGTSDQFAKFVIYTSESTPFISDRFIDVTTETLALNPITHYGAIGYGDPLDHFLWFENLARMPLNAYTTNTTQDFAFLSWGGDGSDGDFYPSIINQTEIPIEIWLKSDTQYVPESSVIESLGLTDEVDNCESGEALLRLIIQVSGGTLGNISFGNIVKSEFIKILYSDMCEFNAFGEDVQIQVNEPSLDYETMSCDDLPEIYFYNDWSLTDTVIVPISDCFLINDNDKITYCAFKTTIPANTIHINGSLYDKPLTVEFGSNTGLIVHESTPYDLQ